MGSRDGSRVELRTVCVSLYADVLDRVDRGAKRGGEFNLQGRLSRSAIVREALDYWLGAWDAAMHVAEDEAHDPRESRRAQHGAEV